MNQSFLIFFILMITIQLYFINSYRCGFDDIEHRKSTFVSMEYDKRKLDSNTYEPIRIFIDTTELDTQGIGSSRLTTIKNALNRAASDYQKLLKVIPISKFQFDESLSENIKSSCGVNTFDPRITGEGIDADIVILAKVYSGLGDKVIAASQKCIGIGKTGKPIMGFILINPNYVGTGGSSELFLKNTLFHEMAHILVFDPNLFQYFGNIGKTTLNEVEYYTIRSENVLSKARKHFNCDSLDGVLLENQGSSGSAGSHWEARIMLGDFMISTDYVENAISEITLALFEDSGWYQVNYYTGGLFRFGKGRGCSFIQNKCVTNGKSNFPNEFCVSQQGPRCTNSHLFYGVCYLKEYSSLPSKYQYFSISTLGGFEAADYCPIGYGNINSEISSFYSTSCVSGSAQYSDVQELGETIGQNSICVISTLRSNNYLEQLSEFTSERAICHKMTCDFTNKQIVFTIAGQTVTCPEEGGVLENPTGFTGLFECPEFNLVCTTYNYCTDISGCLSAKSVSTLAFDSKTGTKIPEDTNYDVKKSNSNVLNKYYLSFISIVILFIID